MQRGQVDLRTCKVGDILVSVHGAVLVYEGIAFDAKHYPHVVRFIRTAKNIYESYLGSRTHDGYTWMEESGREEEDHDIVLIIPKELLQSEDILGATE